MQSVMESLCRCFGSTPMSHPDLSNSGLDSMQATFGGDSLMQKRTQSLSLQDQQWDALFAMDPFPKSSPRKSNNNKESSPQPARTSAATSPSNNKSLLSEAQAVAKSKQQASDKHQHQHNKQLLKLDHKTHKRKRSVSSREDIFRTKQPQSSDSKSGSSAHNQQQVNPISRFLSNHPVIAHSLCFATPVKDDSADHYTDNPQQGATASTTTEVKSKDKSLHTKENPVSANATTESSTADAPSHDQTTATTSTANNANDEEDTVTSTVFYEMTTLAGLFPTTTPPMPLFTSYCLDERATIYQILTAWQQPSSAEQQTQPSAVRVPPPSSLMRTEAAATRSISPPPQQPILSHPPQQQPSVMVRDCHHHHRPTVASKFSWRKKSSSTKPVHANTSSSDGSSSQDSSTAKLSRPRIAKQARRELVVGENQGEI
jgi:hypothetical protein